jgi:hypothetical protein
MRLVAMSAHLDRISANGPNLRCHGEIQPHFEISATLATNTCREFAVAFSAKVACAALREDKTLAQLARLSGLRPNRITESCESIMARGQGKD